MYSNVVYLILDVIGVILLIKYIRIQLHQYKSFQNKMDFFRFKRFKYFIISLIIILVPLLLVNFTQLEETNHLSSENLNQNNVFYALLVSLLISGVWLVYIVRLDIFDKEKKRHIALILFLSIILTSFASYPYQFIHYLGFTDSLNPFDSFAYQDYKQMYILTLPFCIILPLLHKQYQD